MWYYEYTLTFWEELKECTASGHVFARDFADAASALEAYYGNIDTLTISCSEQEGPVFETNNTEKEGI